MHVRHVGRTAAVRLEELREPWHTAVRAAREELARRHPDQTQALIAGLAPFCEPGSTRLRCGALNARTRGPVVRELKQALADGRWRALLEAVGSHDDAARQTHRSPSSLTARSNG